MQHMRAALVCAMAALGAAADEIGSRMQYCDTTPAQREQMLTSARALPTLVCSGRRVRFSLPLESEEPPFDETIAHADDTSEGLDARDDDDDDDASSVASDPPIAAAGARPAKSSRREEASMSSSQANWMDKFDDVDSHVLEEEIYDHASQSHTEHRAAPPSERKRSRSQMTGPFGLARDGSRTRSGTRNRAKKLACHFASSLRARTRETAPGQP